MTTRKAWDNADYEGKALRKTFTRLLKRFMNEDDKQEPDYEKLLKIAHLLTMTAKTKQDLAKYAYQDKRIEALEERIKSRELRKYTDIEGDLPVIS